MILFWNRYEVYVGTSFQDFNNVLDILAAEKIKYSFRTIDYSTMPRYSNMYYVYVHKKNAERATWFLKHGL